MPIIIWTLVYPFLNHLILKGIFFILFMLVFRNKLNKLQIIYILIYVFLFYFLYRQRHYFFGVVVYKNEEYYLIQSLTYRFSFYQKQHNLDVGDFVFISSSNNELSTSLYRHYYLKDISFQNSFPILSVKRILFHRNASNYNYFYENDNIWLFQGLHIRSFYSFVHYLYRRIYEENSKVNFFILLLSLAFFPFHHQHIRLFFRILTKNTHLTYIYTVLYFPKLVLNPSFLLSDAVFILNNLSYRMTHHSKSYLYFLFSSYAFGEVDMLRLLCFPVYRLISHVFIINFLFSYFFPQIKLLNLNFVNLKLRFHISFVSLILLLCLKKKKMKILIILIILMINQNKVFSQVCMIDVGQGDSLYIYDSIVDKHYLIDTGKPSAYSKLKLFLNKKSVYQIDRLFITHDDEDHSGNVDRILKDWKVERIVRSKNDEYASFKLLLKDEFIDSNENSLILYLEMHGVRFMFMGDAYKKQERLLLSHHPYLKADVIKLGHHGSYTSTDLQFLKSLEARIALISSDPKSYGHPHQDVLRKLMDFRIMDLQTSRDGDVCLYLSDKFNYLRTSEGGFAIIRVGDRHD